MVKEIKTTEDIMAENESLLTDLGNAKAYFLEVAKAARLHRKNMEKEGHLTSFFDGRQRARESAYKQAAEILDEIINGVYGA